MFSKVLVANRAEIAVRVIRACRELGVRTVAVYSEADAETLHVKLADESVSIGPAAPSASYLNAERILEAATDTGADAVHPGYGFLSENADFAAACKRKGLVFVGPTAKAMKALGDKVAARRLAIKNDVPVAQGSEGALKDAKDARAIAKDVGFPVLLKAAAGGGGMGMRVVNEAKEVDAAFASASEQAANAFGNGDLFLEKYLERPRHIEVQVLGDSDGVVRHFFERDCSIQRRHQKLIEEAPSPALDAKQRHVVAERAVALAEAGGYTNAGTMEFLFQDDEFYFNEVNARLQVEHPVTELVTGVDLVQWQLRIASGDGIDFSQESVEPRGHALECRINAEDPLQSFMPTPGPVRRYAPPEGPGIRVDTALYTGWTVPRDYDNLVAKLITWAPDREANLRRMRAALHDFLLDGFTTNRAFHLAVLEDEAFRKGDFTTRFLEERGVLKALEAERGRRLEDAAVLAAALTTAPRGGLGSLAVRHATPPRRSI